MTEVKTIGKSHRAAGTVGEDAGVVDADNAALVKVGGGVDAVVAPHGGGPLTVQRKGRPPSKDA